MKKAIIQKNTSYQNVEITLSNLLIVLGCYIIHAYLDNAGAILYVCPILVILNSLRYFIRLQVKGVIDFIIRWRWIIGLIVFIILVMLRVHGSSISAFNTYTGADQVTDTGELFGTGRTIRSDEFNVQVPYFFSQYYNGYNEISYQMSVSGQDMIIGYNSPVLDLTLIGKPFVWGYILFGNEIGLSWYWCSKTIFALLLAFEACRILTKNDYISLFGSALIVFSPAVQWWFSPHMFDVYIWCMAIFTVGYHFFTAKNRLWKVLTTVFAVSVLDGFVLALFPSLQVGIGYVVIVLTIGCLYRDRECITFHKRDFLRIATVILIVGAILGHFVWNAREAIQLLSNTVYPGKRVSTGNDQNISVLFFNLNMLFTPYEAPGLSNECELANFIHMGVLCMLLQPYMAFACRKGKGSKRWFSIGWIFFVAILIQSEVMLIGIPEWLAKITLFSYINRMYLVYGFTACLFTIWTITTIFKYHESFDTRIMILLTYVYAVLYCVAASYMVDPVYEKMLPGGKDFYMALALAFSFIGLLMVLNWKRFLVAFCCALIGITSMTVNPVVTGISTVTDYDFVQAALSYNEDDEGSWLAVGGLVEQNLLLANGLQVLNAVNYYPDFTKWEALDPSEEYEDNYNRYAYIRIELTDEETYMENGTADLLIVYINPADLYKLDVKYILINHNESERLENSGIDCKMLYSNEGYYIYKLD